MANHIGVDGLVTVGGVTVAELKGFSIEESVNAIDNSTINDTASSVVAGRSSWTGTIECQWDETDATGQGAMTIGATVAVVFKPEGDTAADANFTGSALVTSVSKSVADEAVITQSFSLTGIGALVEGVEA